MRRAHNDVGWLTFPQPGASDGANAASGSVPPTPQNNADSEGSVPADTVYGFSLGFDFCAEHEYGARLIRDELGIANVECPIGVEQRTMTRVPNGLHFVVYGQRPKDRRFKKTMPAALLVLTDDFRLNSEKLPSPAELAKRFDALFWTDFTDTRYRPGVADIVCSWSSHGGFVIHVRGDENVHRLAQVHEAMKQCRVAVADPAYMGFARKALALVLVDKLPPEVHDTVLQKDLAHQRLLQAAKDTGIEELLAKHGKGWYALSPAWEYEEGGNLLFFLNPREQRQYEGGWVTVEDLHQWTKEKGPIVDSQEISKIVKKDVRDWGIHLLRGLNLAGIKMRRHEKFVWLDDAKSEVGVVLSVHRDTEHLLKSGVYPLSQVLPYVKQGKALEPVS